MARISRKSLVAATLAALVGVASILPAALFA